MKEFVIEKPRFEFHPGIGITVKVELKVKVKVKVKVKFTLEQATKAEGEMYSSTLSLT